MSLTIYFYIPGKLVNVVLSNFNIQGGMFHKALIFQLESVRNTMEYPDQVECFSPP